MFNVNIQRILSNNISFFVLRQQFQNNFRKEVRIATCILDDCFNKRFIELMQIVQFNVQFNLSVSFPQIKFHSFAFIKTLVFSSLSLKVDIILTCSRCAIFTSWLAYLKYLAPFSLVSQILWGMPLLPLKRLQFTYSLFREMHFGLVHTSERRLPNLINFYYIPLSWA